MNRYGTPLTTGFFLVSGITGVSLFFHLGPAAFHPMHEWFGMMLLAPFALHIVKNWPALVGYVRRGTLYVPVLVALAVASFFFAGQGQKGPGNRQIVLQTASLVTRAPLSEIAPLFHADGDTLVRRLDAGGFHGAVADQSLDAIARAAGRPANEALAVLVISPRKGK